MARLTEFVDDRFAYYYRARVHAEAAGRSHSHENHVSSLRVVQQLEKLVQKDRYGRSSHTVPDTDHGTGFEHGIAVGVHRKIAEIGPGGQLDSEVANDVSWRGNISIR